MSASWPQGQGIQIRVEKRGWNTAKQSPGWWLGSNGGGWGDYWNLIHTEGSLESEPKFWMCGCGRINRMLLLPRHGKQQPPLHLGGAPPIPRCPQEWRATESVSNEGARKNKPAGLPYCPYHIQAQVWQPQVCLPTNTALPGGGKASELNSAQGSSSCLPEITRILRDDSLLPVMWPGGLQQLTVVGKNSSEAKLP